MAVNRVKDVTVKINMILRWQNKKVVLKIKGVTVKEEFYCSNECVAHCSASFDRYVIGTTLKNYVQLMN